MRLPNGYGSVVKMSGRRRNPYMVRKTSGWHYDAEKDKQIQDYIIIGYAKTKADGLKMLADYNANPFDAKAAKAKFSEIYDEWSKRKYQTISTSNVSGYVAAYNACEPLHNKVFKDIRLADLQKNIDTCGKNYPTLQKIKVLYSQLYDFAIKNEICSKDYSAYVDIAQYKDRNPNKLEREKFTRDEIDRIWEFQDDSYYQIILMLIYSGTRISEFLNLKKVDVHLEDQYFDVIRSKTVNGLRQVPIADKVLPFFQAWYNSSPECEYLIHTPEGEHFGYRNFYGRYFLSMMERLEMTHTPHCCRHTCVSMLAEAGVDSTLIKKIVGHSGSMTMTERVYTHIDVQVLVDAINKI